VRRSLLGVLFTPLVLAACEPRGPDQGPEWELLRSLAAPTGLTAPEDRSNRYSGDPAAQDLGRRFYFDTDFSGRSTLVDMLGRPVGSPPARAPKGQPIHVSCATCHDPARGGSDHTSQAQVSMGAGAYDVSSQPSVNSAFATLWYWNGRNDSLWSQIVAVTESHGVGGQQPATRGVADRRAPTAPTSRRIFEPAATRARRRRAREARAPRRQRPVQALGRRRLPHRGPA
jgi:hypothetical protein